MLIFNNNSFKDLVKNEKEQMCFPEKHGIFKRKQTTQKGVPSVWSAVKIRMYGPYKVSSTGSSFMLRVANRAIPPPTKVPTALAMIRAGTVSGAKLSA